MGLQGSLSFPANPVINQTYDHGGKTYKWTGVGWRKIAPSSFGVNPPGIVRLGYGSLNNAAALTIIFTGLLDVYRGFLLKIPNAICDTDATLLFLRTSTDGGVTFDAGATDYGYANWLQSDAGAQTVNGGVSNGVVIGNSLIGNVSTEGMAANLEMFSLKNQLQWAKILINGYAITSEATPGARAIVGGGARKLAQDVDAIQVKFNTPGLILSMDWALYGYA